MVEESIVFGRPQADEQKLDEQLRPLRLGDFVGQAKLVDNLRLYIDAAKRRSESLDHVLFCGPPGLGKTTLARIVANEMGSRLFSTNGPALTKAADLAGFLTQLGEGDIFFLDEIHRIPPTLEEYLYSAMEDYVIDINLDPGNVTARTVRLDLPRFTLIGATTKEGALQAPFRDRFGIVERLKYYEAADLQTIAERNAKLLECAIDGDAAHALALRSRGTPRVVNRFLRRARDVATVGNSGGIDVATVERMLEMLEVDALGLTYIDRKILEILHRSHPRAVGLNTLAASISEDRSTIEDVYEPFLIQQNLVQKTPSGRILTERAFSCYFSVLGKE